MKKINFWIILAMAIVATTGFVSCGDDEEDENIKKEQTTDVEATSISLSSEELNLQVGDQAKLKATVKPSEASSKLVWSSSDEEVAKVDKEGNVTAVGVGSTVIKVKTDNGISAKCEVTVTKAAPAYPLGWEILLSNASGLKDGEMLPSSVTLAPGESFGVSPYNTEAGASFEIAEGDIDAEVSDEYVVEPFLREMGSWLQFTGMIPGTSVITLIFKDSEEEIHKQKISVTVTEPRLGWINDVWADATNEVLGSVVKLKVGDGLGISAYDRQAGALFSLDTSDRGMDADCDNDKVIDFMIREDESWLDITAKEKGTAVMRTKLRLNDKTYVSYIKFIVE